MIAAFIISKRMLCTFCFAISLILLKIPKGFANSNTTENLTTTPSEIGLSKATEGFANSNTTENLTTTPSEIGLSKATEGFANSNTTENLTTTPSEIGLSKATEPDQSIVNSYPCPKECECYLFYSPKHMQVTCTLDVLNKDRYFSELNQTTFLSYVVVYCNQDNVQSSRLTDGIFESLHAVLILEIKNCRVTYVSAYAFSGMRSLIQLEIKGGIKTYFEKKSFQIPALSGLGAVVITETGTLSAPSFCNLEQLWLVNLTKNNIKRFEDTGLLCDQPGNIEVIDISDNYITHLPSKFISITRKLTCLSSDRNKINAIEATIFENLTNIGILNLKRNQLTSFPSDFLGNNSKIRTLKLAYNKAEVLPRGIFSRLQSMFFLDLDGMGLSNNVWPELENLTTLQVLHINNNNINFLDREAMHKLTRLKMMEIYGNSIQYIPKGTFASQTDMFFLNISSNSIRSIGNGSFDGLTYLETLDLKRNQIKSIHPEAFSGLIALQLLNLSFNYIDKLPRFPLTLHWLDLRCNDITHFESSTFYGLFRLNGLSLINNRLTNLPSNAFITNRDLILLNLASNNISSIDNRIFSKPSSLKSLILRNNSVSNIEPFADTHFPSLKILDLSHNNLNVLIFGKSSSLFPNSLEELFLAWNQIHSIQNFAFQLPNIRDIDLRMNLISTVSNWTLQVLQTSLMPVNYYLLGNPFLCDCNLNWLKEVSLVRGGAYSESYIIRDFSRLYCAKVYRHKPGLIKDLPSSKFLCPYKASCLSKCTCYNMSLCPCCTYCPKNCSCYRNTNDVIDITDCSTADLETVPLNISKRCTILDVSGNHLRTISPGDVNTLAHMTELYLNYSEIFEIKEGSFNGLTNLTKLDLGHNFLKILVSGIFKGMQSLKFLIVSFNEIAVIEEKSFMLLTDLQYLDLSVNKLEAVSRFEFASMSKLTSLKLSDNPWSCDCRYLVQMKNFTLANAKHILDFNRIACEKLNSTTNETEKHLLAEVHLPDFCLNKTLMFNQTKTISYTLSKSAITVLSTVLCLFLVGLLIFGIGFWNREFLKIWCFIKFGFKFCQTERDENNRLFDAFVSYSSHDEEFILRELIPRLEEPGQNRQGFKLCLHFRDFPVGASIAESIIFAVKSSRRIIIILSDNFLNSEWCQYEFQAAHHQLLKDKRNRIIMVLLNDINSDLLDEQLKLFLRTRTYVKYGDPWFWPKIEYAMPKANPVNEVLIVDYLDDDIQILPGNEDFVNEAENGGEVINMRQRERLPSAESDDQDDIRQII